MAKHRPTFDKSLMLLLRNKGCLSPHYATHLKQDVPEGGVEESTRDF